MNLLDAPDRHGSDLDVGDGAEVFRMENADLAVIAKKNIRLVPQGMPIDGPERSTLPDGFDGRSVIEIMIVVVIDRRKPREDDGTTDEPCCTPIASQHTGSVERASLDWKLLLLVPARPCEVPRLRERPHLPWVGREAPCSRLEFTIEEFRERAIDDG